MKDDTIHGEMKDERGCEGMGGVAVLGTDLPLEIKIEVETGR